MAQEADGLHSLGHLLRSSAPSSLLCRSCRGRRKEKEEGQGRRGGRSGREKRREGGYIVCITGAEPLFAALGDCQTNSKIYLQDV